MYTIALILFKVTPAYYIVLQAVARVEVSQRWIDDYATHLQSFSTIDEAALHLPVFFEFCAACIDEVLRDVSYLHTTI